MLASYTIVTPVCKVMRFEDSTLGSCRGRTRTHLELPVTLFALPPPITHANPSRVATMGGQEAAVTGHSHTQTSYSAFGVLPRQLPRVEMLCIVLQTAVIYHIG